MQEKQEEQEEQESQQKKEESKYDFNKLQDRRRYIQDHPGQFPKAVQKFLLGHEPYKENISWFAYHLAQDVTTRHEAHWQLQSFLLLEIWKLLEELVKGSTKKSPETVANSGIRRRKT